MGLEFSTESKIGFNGKVSDEGDIEVVVEGKVGNIKRIIEDFSEDYRLEGLNSFYILRFSRTPQFYSIVHIGLSIVLQISNLLVSVSLDLVSNIKR